jgi:hypothetical protein
VEKETYTNEPFKDLITVINGVPTELNVLGGMKTEDGREWLVITDMPILEIGAEEYEIFQLVRSEEKISIKSIDTKSNNYENLDLYNELVEMWEKVVEEDGNE